MSEVVLQRISDDTLKKPLSESELRLKIHPPLIVGRGPTLRCADKRVSRNHATIDWDDSGILVTSVHVNPTFIDVGGKKFFLSQGQSAVLKDGDKFGLLKDTFWFKIFKYSSLKINAQDKAKSLSLKAEEQPSPPVEENVEKDSEKTQSAGSGLFSSLEKEDSMVSDPKSSKPQNQQIVKIVDEKEARNKHTVIKVSSYCSTHERKLPCWMLKGSNENSDISDSYQNASKNLKLKHHGKLSRITWSKLPDVNHRRSTEALTETTPIKSPAKNKAAKNKKYHTVSQDFEISDSDLPNAEQKLHTLSDDESVIPLESNRISEDEIAEENINQNKKNYNIHPKKQNTARSSCEYGRECYRKNPHHRRIMAHPGDNDYYRPDSDSEDNDDDRPECEYGVDCYRQNLQHKKEYKHTRKPQPQRQAKRKARQQRKKEEGDDSENEYDFSDPFLNDSSSDDYDPTDSSDQDTDIVEEVEEEDTKRMIKEAKSFIKRRRK